MYTSYNEMGRKIENRKSFEGNSVSGFTSKGIYYVKSYNTVILEVHSDGIWFDNRYYSNTTNRIQGIIKRAFNLDCTYKGKRGGLHNNRNTIVFGSKNGGYKVLMQEMEA